MALLPAIIMPLIMAEGVLNEDDCWWNKEGDVPLPGLELPSWLAPDFEESGVIGVDRQELFPSTEDFKW